MKFSMQIIIKRTVTAFKVLTMCNFKTFLKGYYDYASPIY